MTPDPTRTPSLHLQLDGFEGPLDLLLELARGQKVDLAKISIVALVDQFLAVLDQARAVRLELAADAARCDCRVDKSQHQQPDEISANLVDHAHCTSSSRGSRVAGG